LRYVNQTFSAALITKTYFIALIYDTSNTFFAEKTNFKPFK